MLLFQNTNTGNIFCAHRLCMGIFHTDISPNNGFVNNNGFANSGTILCGAIYSFSGCIENVISRNHRQTSQNQLCINGSAMIAQLVAQKKQAEMTTSTEKKRLLSWRLISFLEPSTNHRQKWQHQQRNNGSCHEGLTGLAFLSILLPEVGDREKPLALITFSKSLSSSRSLQK